MIKAFSVLLLLCCFVNITKDQETKMPGQSEYEMAGDLLQSKKYTAWLSVLEMAVVKNHPEAIIRKGDN